MDDTKYLKLITNRLSVCKNYQPKFGQGARGISYSEFKTIYSEDIFYSWFGLDNPLMYAAHKAAGGITSIYRQLGLGCEEVFRAVLQDSLGLTEGQSIWSYQQETNTGKNQTLKLDGRIELTDLQANDKTIILQEWIKEASHRLDLDSGISSAIRGIVMEIRQGYKSKDAKRQNADMNNAAQAYAKAYLPVLIVLSNQIDNDILERYERGKWLVLRGVIIENNFISSYSFTKNILGYDLAAFFERNRNFLQNYMLEILESLLKADNNA